MKYSYNWLKELSKTKSSPEKLADVLTMRAFEIDGIERNENKLDKVIVGKILEIQKHPNADKLQITKVSVGASRDLPLQIVCGAKNIQVGDKVPVALVGAVLPNGLEIKEASIRGEKSFGMLCAPDELGFGTDHNGILILDKNEKIGERVDKILGLDDTILDFKILPDRGHDALSHVGLAREICVLENRKFDYKQEKNKLASKKSKKLKVEIKDKDLCSRYIGAVMENVEVKESPMWIKSRLLACGVRPINNIVDATNYVMLETGQPLHAFDFEMIKNSKIVVRRAKNGEEIKLLDESVKKLSSDDAVIADTEKPLAIAGVMGGEHSGVSENTKALILESANFNASNIRRTRVRLNLKTEASDRFEKDIDPNLAEIAMARLVEIISETAGGKLEGMADEYPKKLKNWKIKLDLEYVNNLLGEEVPKKEVVKILELLGVKISAKGGSASGRKNIIEAEIPTRRLDLKTQEDLIEEIGRVYGYDKIKPQAPNVPLGSAPVNETRFFERKTKEILTGLGMDEVYNYSFYSVKDAEMAKFDAVKHLELQNPMNPDQALVRASLVPNILKNVRENLKHFKSLEIFEIGKVYQSNAGNFPREDLMLTGAVVLEENPKTKKIARESVFFEAKSQVDALLQKLGIADFYFDYFNATPERSFSDLWHEGRRAEIRIEGSDEEIGFVGEINPMVTADFDINKRVAMFEIDMRKLKKVSVVAREYAPIGKFPTVTRDISLLAENEIRVDDILKTIQSVGGDLVKDVDLFDIFELEDKNSFAFHIIFESLERTLESAEVDKLMEKITQLLESDLGVEVRK